MVNREGREEWFYREGREEFFYREGREGFFYREGRDREDSPKTRRILFK